MIILERWCDHEREPAMSDPIYPLRILYATDQWLNVFLAPLLNLLLSDGSYKFGNPDETLSSVMGKNIKLGKCRGCYYICRVLHLFDKDHCMRPGVIEEDEHAGYK